MQHVVEHNHYREGRDSPNIPLNTESPNFNAWRLQRPRSMDPDREPGPVPLGRYDGDGGPPTFGGHPLALSKEDLVAGEVDVAILGAPQAGATRESALLRIFACWAGIWVVQTSTFRSMHPRC